MIALLLACRLDPGLPDYPEPEAWTREGEDFYNDPLAEGEERLSYGLFYEGPTTEALVIDDVVNHFYIYSGTFSVVLTDDRWEGYEAAELVKGNQAWWGGGIHWDEPRDISDWDTLHLVVKTEDLSDWDIGMTGGGVEARVSAADAGLVADDEWHELEVPLAELAAGGADLSAVTVGLLMVGESGEEGASATVDGLYLSRVQP